MRTADVVWLAVVQNTTEPSGLERDTSEAAMVVAAPACFDNDGAAGHLAIRLAEPSG
jgi:hypothetical protein